MSLYQIRHMWLLREYEVITEEEYASILASYFNGDKYRVIEACVRLAMHNSGEELE